MREKLNIFGFDGLIVNLVKLPYPSPQNEQEEIKNTYAIISNTKITRFAKIYLKLLRGDKCIITGRKSKYLNENTEEILKKLFRFSSIPVDYYHDNFSYLRDNYFKHKVLYMCYRAINYHSLDIYDADLSLCIHIFNLFNSNILEFPLPRITRIFWIPDPNKLKRIEVDLKCVYQYTQNLLSEISNKNKKTN